VTVPRLRVCAFKSGLSDKKGIKSGSPPLAAGAGGGEKHYLLRVKRYSTPIAPWQTTQISSAVPKACGPREASG